MKRKLTLWLAMVMALALGMTAAIAEEEQQPLEYTGFASPNSGYSLDDNLAWQTWEDMFNIHVEFEFALGSDLLEKRNLILASGEYPEIFYKSGFSMSDLNKYGQQGLFMPLEDLIYENMPNLVALLDELDGWDYMKSTDGHIYSLPELLPQLHYIGSANDTFWINKAWMDTLGLEEPKSFDELYEVLKAFKEGDPNGNGEADEIPLSISDNKYNSLLSYADFAYDADTRTAVIDGVLTYIPTSDSYKEFLAWLTKLYADGLLYANSFTQTGEQESAIGQSGDVLGSFVNAGAFLVVGRDNDDDYIILTPFHEGTYPLRSSVNVGTFVVTDRCENVAPLLAAMDYFYTEEGGILAWLGVEGKTYEVDEDGDWHWLVGNGYGDDIATIRASNALQGGAGSHTSVLPAFWFEHMSVEADPDEVYLNGERAKASATGVVPLPMMNYTEEENEEIATIKTDVDAYINQYVAQVVTGAVTLEDSWDDYVATLDKMGQERLIEIYQDVYARAIAE